MLPGEVDEDKTQTETEEQDFSDLDPADNPTPYGGHPADEADCEWDG